MKACSILALAVASLTLSSCQESFESGIQRHQAKEWSRISKGDLAVCRSKGGTYKGVGIFGTPSCVIPYSDAGKVCRDSSDCVGKCTIELDQTKGESQRTSGFCEADNAHFGCFAEIVNGVEQPGICVD
jgi:hypothetical protein